MVRFSQLTCLWYYIQKQVSLENQGEGSGHLINRQIKDEYGAVGMVDGRIMR